MRRGAYFFNMENYLGRIVKLKDNSMNELLGEEKAKQVFGC